MKIKKTRRRMHKDYREVGQDSKYLVAVSYPEDADTDIDVTARIVDRATKKAVEKYPERKRTAKSLSDLEVTINYAVGAVKKQLNPPRTPKGSKKNGGTYNSQLHKAFKLVEKNWSEHYTGILYATFHEYYTFVWDKCLPYLSECQDDVCFEPEKMKEKIREAVNNNPKAFKSVKNVDYHVNRHYRDAAKMYTLARIYDPTLADLDFGEIEIVKYDKGNEQVKRLPTHILVGFCRRLLEDIKICPKLVRAAAILYGIGARPSEAAAVTSRETIDIGIGLRVKIIFQEKGGKRSKILKNDASYRTTPADFFIRHVVLKCNKLIGEESEEESPVTSEELAKYVIRLLEESGLTEEMKKEITADMKYDNTLDPKDSPAVRFTTHVMRRNRASIATDTCGHTEAEVDAGLGHKTDKAKPIRGKMLTDEYCEFLLRKNELFVPVPEYSLNPQYHPIDMSKEAKINCSVYGEYVLSNPTDQPIMLTVNVSASEPGEYIEIIRESSETAIDLRSYDDLPDRYRRRNRYIIGREREKNEEVDNRLE